MRAKLWSRRLLVGTVLGALGLLHLLCPFQIGVVSGASMEPSFRSGQVILIDRRYYRGHQVHRGDVVILKQDGAILIKRVYALAGDSFWTLINTDDGELYRDIVDPVLLPRFRRLLPTLPGYRLTRFTVPPGTIYIVGDHTNASVDSRQFGPVPLSCVLGRVTHAPPAKETPALTAVARR